MTKYKRISPYLTLDGLLAFFCLISLVGAVIYYFFSLSISAVIITVILSILLFIILKKYIGKNEEMPASSNIPGSESKMLICILAVLFLSLTAFEFHILFNSRTSFSIISPWQVVPKYFFIAYLANSFVLLNLTALFKKTQSGLTHALLLTMIILHYVTAFSVALIVYAISYGFDPFVHRATVKYIMEQGAIYPKPLYYLGQYSLFVVLGKIFQLSTALLDKFFIPFFSALLIPIYAIKNFKKSFSKDSSPYFPAILLLIMPFSLFILTNPQSFSYVLIIILVLQGLSVKDKKGLALLYLVALTIIAIQPISGIPALFFVILLHLYLSPSRNKLSMAITFFAIVSLPIAFYISSPDKSLLFSYENFHNFFKSFALNIPNKQNIYLNFAYLYGFNAGLLVFLLSITGAYLSFKEKMHSLSVYFLMSVSMIFSYLLTLFLPFDYLIDYERGFFSDRLLIISAIFSLPFILLSLKWISDKILTAPGFLKASWLLALAPLMTASLYYSYPRFDNYFNSRGYSTGQYDIEAVDWIGQTAKNDHIVLANQQVSAAALSRFGFKKYYQRTDCTAGSSKECQNKYLGQIFFYPIPTGGPLYRYYLDMVYEKPSKETMKKAMDLAGVSEGYFVLNKYWWAFTKILEEAKLEADSWHKLGDGEVYIFRYESSNR
jgi:hypothetical protein